MKIGKKKLLTLRDNGESITTMKPGCHTIESRHGVGLVYGFDHGVVWRTVMDAVRSGRQLLATEYTLMQHRRSGERGILLQATFQT